MQRRPLARMVVLAAGCTLVVLGTVGLVLPVLQGVLLILLGLYVLSRESRTARRLHEQLLARHPGLRSAVERAKARLRRLQRRLWPKK